MARHTGEYRTWQLILQTLAPVAVELWARFRSRLAARLRPRGRHHEQ